MISTLFLDKMHFRNCLETREKPVIKEQTEFNLADIKTDESALCITIV